MEARRHCGVEGARSGRVRLTGHCGWCVLWLQSSLKQQRGQSGPGEDKDGALCQETRESPGWNQEHQLAAVPLSTETGGQMQMSFCCFLSKARTANRQEMRRDGFFPRLLSFVLPCPITDIRIIMLRDGGAFSQCPEAAFLSAHKHLWEWVNHRGWNALPESVITASGLNCQPLTTGHMQRNDTLKWTAAIKYQTGANSYQVGRWSFNVTLFDDLDNPGFNPSSKDGQWGVLEVHGEEKKNSSLQVLPTPIFIIVSFGLPTFLKRTALPLASP